ncbi:hypothetical protein L2E82_33347 [Cichorium intybus]|uniref:Uncharacterized protein n=1 Tax=Cichorium intybus TaxID=13427 RepID=A0ACB9BJV8_CICIN|nr:hypothetical protein L2E82_33347 [Cichorium intybus]
MVSKTRKKKEENETFNHDLAGAVRRCKPRTKTPHAPFTPRKYPDNESQRPSNGQWGKVDELGQSPCPYLLQALKAKKSTRKAKKATSSLANDDEGAYSQAEDFHFHFLAMPPKARLVG